MENLYKPLTKSLIVFIIFLILTTLLSGCDKNSVDKIGYNALDTINATDSDSYKNVSADTAADDGIITPEELRVLQHLTVDDVDLTEFPKTIGTIDFNGESRTLVHKYYCSDLCPDNGRLYVLFEGINSVEECEDIGGNVVKDVAWGSYIGCNPMFTYID